MDRKELRQIRKEIRHESKGFTEFEQKLVIINFFTLETLERVSLILHIIAIITGTLSIIGLTLHINSFMEIIFEILTIFIILLIVLWAILKPVFKKMILKKNIDFVWGNNKIKTRLTTIEAVKLNKLKKNSNLITIEKEKHYVDFQNIWLGFTKMTPSKKFIYKIDLNYFWKKILSDDDNEKESTNKNLYSLTIPSFILIDPKEKSIEITSKNTFVFSKDNKLLNTIKIPINFKINYELETISWSGSLPNNPTHGCWEVIKKK